MKATHLIATLALTAASAAAFAEGGSGAGSNPVTGAVNKATNSANQGADKAKNSASDPGTQSSQGVAASGGISFGSLDTNSDGSLSRPEVAANAGVQAKFKDLDIDRNGSLSTSEFSKFEDMGDSSTGKAKNKAEDTKGDLTRGTKDATGR